MARMKRSEEQVQRCIRSPPQEQEQVPLHSHMAQPQVPLHNHMAQPQVPLHNHMAQPQESLHNRNQQQRHRRSELLGSATVSHHRNHRIQLEPRFRSRKMIS